MSARSALLRMWFSARAVSVNGKGTPWAASTAADPLRGVADLVELTALRSKSSIEPPTAPALATRRIASAASAGLGP